MKNTSETNALRRQFSLIRDRQSVLDDIYASENLKLMFDSWNEEQQTRFLDICPSLVVNAIFL